MLCVIVSSMSHANMQLSTTQDLYKTNVQYEVTVIYRRNVIVVI